MQISPTVFLRKLRQKYIFLLFLPVCAVLILFICHAAAVYTKPLESQTVSLDFYNSDNQNWDVYTFNQGQKQSLKEVSPGEFEGLSHTGQTFYTSRILTETLDSPILRIYAESVPCSIFLDETLLYTDAPDADNRPGHVDLEGSVPSRGIYIYISMPADYTGKNLTIVQSHPFQEKPDYNTVFPLQAALYTEAAAASTNISAAANDMIPVIIMACVSILLLIFLLYKAWESHLDPGLFFLTMFSIFLMLYSLLSADAAHYYLKESWRLAYELFYYGGIAFLILFLSTRMNIRWCRYLQTGAALLQLCTMVLSFCIQTYSLIPYGDLYVSFMFLNSRVSAFILFISLALMLYEAYRKTVFFRLMSIFFLIFTLVNIPVQWVLYSREYGFLYILHQGFTISEFQGVYVSFTQLISTFFLASSIILVLHEYITKSIQKNIQLENLTLRSQLASQSYHTIQQHMNEMSKLRHDMKKHYSMIYAFLQNQDTKQALSYTQDLLKTTHGLKTVANTDNYLIDTIINSKYPLFESEQIHTSFRSGRLPSRLPVADNDLCSLLLNILDNALEASLKLKPEKRRLDIQLLTKNNRFYFICKNAADHPHVNNQTAPLPLLRKQGYGLEIIRQIVKKYHGEVSIQCEEDFFSISFYLPLVGYK